MNKDLYISLLFSYPFCTNEKNETYKNRTELKFIYVYD